MVKQAYMLHAAGRMGLHNPNGTEFPVNVRTLDSVARNVDFKIIKIDAENWTPNVLRGAKEVLEKRPDLILECTQTGMGEILKPLGYRFWMIKETGEITEVEDLIPYNPNDSYNGTDEDSKNRFCSVKGLP
jgi:hypothetical protein